MSTDTTITYGFRFDDGSSREFALTMSHPTLDVTTPRIADRPMWTELAFYQCPNCPLDAERHPHCPVAVNLAPVVIAFTDCVSFAEVEVSVQTEDRTYVNRCALQAGVSSLMGLIMPTSGCPHLDKLRPMVFTHLPFSTPDQTTFRAVSMYLLAQFFRQRRGQTPDWELKELSRTYDEVRRVNRAFAKRLASIHAEDANINAIVRLDNQADITAFSITESWWDDIEPAFQPYLSAPQGNGPDDPP
ncbi:MAG: hypothetical protein GY842_11320 [bacterium]|nr:hypothetical protein [bacterium]